MKTLKETKIDKIIDDFLDGAYFNRFWDEEYESLRKKLKEELK